VPPGRLPREPHMHSVRAARNGLLPRQHLRQRRLLLGRLVRGQRWDLPHAGLAGQSRGHARRLPWFSLRGLRAARPALLPARSTRALSSARGVRSGRGVRQRDLRRLRWRRSAVLRRQHLSGRLLRPPARRGSWSAHLCRRRRQLRAPRPRRHLRRRDRLLRCLWRNGPALLQRLLHGQQQLLLLGGVSALRPGGVALLQPHHV